MQGLQYLETLRIDSRIREVPPDIVHLPGLLHLSLPGDINLPNGIARMTSLQSLGCFDLSSNSADNVMNLGELTNLQDLRLTCSTMPSDNREKKFECLGSILSKLCHLKSLTLLPTVSNANTLEAGALSNNISCDGLGSVSSPPALLQKLWLLPRICIFSILPEWIGKLRLLGTIKIQVMGLSCDDVDILEGLPALTALTLYVRTTPAERIVFDKEGCPVLKHFKFICSALCIAFVKGAMPNVRRLKLGFDANTIVQYSLVDAGFENLTGLEEISAKIGSAGADEYGRMAAQSALEAAFSPCRVNIQWVDWIFYGEKERSTAAQKEKHRTLENCNPIPDVVTKGGSDEQCKIGEKGSRQNTNKQADSKITLSMESSDEQKEIQERDSREYTSKQTDAGVMAQTAQKTREHIDFQSDVTTCGKRRKEFKDKFQEKCFIETLNLRLNIPAKSAPSNVVSSSVQSHQRLSSVDSSLDATSTQDTNVRSALSVWSSDLLGSSPPCTQDTNVLSAMSLEKNEGRQECSPHSSRSRSPASRSKNPSAPPSPVDPKVFLANHVSRPESNRGANYHPLPLPPASVCPKQPNVSGQSVAKIEMPSMDGPWLKGKLIGSGTFGCLYEATNRQTGALCAMKEFNIILDDAKSSQSLKKLEQEIKFLSQFKHENIVQYYGSEIIEGRLYMYLEYVHPGSIHKYVHQHCGSLTESVIRNFMGHTLKGLAFLHSQKIVHGDIRGANLLVDVNGVVKLAYFGMAKHLNTAAPNLSLKGTPYWMAPEVVRATLDKNVGYDRAVDIWSIGCTIIEMFTGKPPWSNLEGPAAMFKVLRADPPIPDNLSPEGKDFLRCCFTRDPALRPTASNLLKHPFVQNSFEDTGHGSRDEMPWKNDLSTRGQHADDETTSARSSESFASGFTPSPNLGTQSLSPPLLSSGPPARTTNNMHLSIATGRRQQIDIKAQHAVYDHR
uniref:mitogen-activated protein kinase kinase kinase n=1 Tax=Arundo donax TaxID=35708 RepID=A0A0A9FL81_ARUDO